MKATCLALAAVALPVLVASPSAALSLVDPCLQCGAVYSSNGSGRLFVIDPATGTSTACSGARAGDLPFHHASSDDLATPHVSPLREFSAG